jgi:hypothetical protein
MLKATGNELIITLPFINVLQLKLLVATAVYVPGNVCAPKLMAAPVPATGDPTLTDPFSRH